MVPSLSHFENLPYEAMGIEECSAGQEFNFSSFINISLINLIHL